MDLTLFNNQINRGNGLAVSAKTEANALQLIEKRKSDLTHEAVIAKLHPNEYAIAAAGLNTPVRLYDDRSLNDVIFEFTPFICRDVGITKWNDEEKMTYESIRFVKILRAYYSDLSIEEVKAAFELAAVGMLDDHLPKDRDGNPDKHHYQSFSMEYYTKILNAFRAKKSQVWGKVRLALPVPEMVISEEQREFNKKMFHAEIYEAYINYQKGVYPNFPLSIYIKELQQLGHIKDLPTPTKAQIEKAYRHTILTGGLDRDAKKRIINDYSIGKIASSIMLEAELKAYNVAISKIFDIWIKKGFDLIDKKIKK